MTKSGNQSKFRNLIALYLLYIIFWIIIIALLRNLYRPAVPMALTRFIPLNDLFLELGIIFIVILPLSGIIGLIIGGYIISPLILSLHKKIYRSKRHYGIQRESSSDKTKLLSKGFFPVLMAINFSSIFLTPTVVQFILSANLIIEFDVVSNIPILTRFFIDIVLLIFTFGLATMFFSSVWFLKDSGIIYSNKQKIENSNELVVLHSIGDWYQTILKSYAGIGVFITYTLVVRDFITRYIENIGTPGNIFNIPSLVLWLGMPLYLILSLIPAIIINEVIKKSRVNYILKFSNRLGIKDTAVISFEFKERSE
ncbi:MAG: hypothetical protein KAW51_09390 [Candidatus Lokiarchaeota archaeon]|nr:hypothetical protein [Candidatus Lokiarchaeota archaeon]